jgi:cytochrome c-type biogenesis protein CcmH/NrfF
MTDLFRTIAHAAIWSTVGRIIWHAPWLVVVLGAAVAAAYLLRGRRARR